jgi:HK97 family phage portal protein
VKSLANPSAELLEIFALQGAAGISVSTEQALHVPAVACAISVIALSVASLPLGVKRIDGNVETDAPEHPVAALLRRDLNDWTSWIELIADLVGDALIADTGGVAIVARAGDGRILEAVRCRRGTVEVRRHLVTDEPSYYLDSRPLELASVLHVRSPLGRAPISLARGSAAIAYAMQTHAGRLFGNGARPSGALTFQRGMAEDAVKKSIAGWRSAHEGADSSGKTAILHDGAEFEPFQLSSTDAQFAELWLLAIQEVARCFNVPAAMLGELSRATWSNLEGKHREFLTVILEPWLLTVEAAMRRALFLPEERDRFVIRFDRDDFGRADLSSRATAINSLIASRTLSPNEGRAWLGLAPRDGGDEFLNPNITAAAPAPAAEDPRQ